MLFPKNLGSIQEWLSIENGLPQRLVSRVKCLWIISMAYEAEMPAYCILFIFMQFGSMIFLDGKKSFDSDWCNILEWSLHTSDWTLSLHWGKKTEQMAIAPIPHKGNCLWYLLIRGIFIMISPIGRQGTSIFTGYDELPGLPKTYSDNNQEHLWLPYQTAVFPENSELQPWKTDSWILTG